ncbi:response regulator [Rhizobium sp. KVB221]|uniref:Response regulator n=1 Tax=Rhizobium setariae TaxID=2801340 RepID=A0A937CQD6_9HYPH|nr:response regulator [Rhizobium setariae]MBL0373748.1 response regulator [Rhizobium setariae]
MAQLIVVDDDQSLCGMIEDFLTTQGHVVRCATSGESLDVLVGEGAVDLILLDLNLPGEDGLSIARRMREHHDLGIIMLTGAIDLVDRVVGLEIGADDYVTKPFSLNELNARIEAVLRRRRFRAEDMIPFGAFSLDLKQWKLFEPNGDEVPLFPTEIDLIAAFATRPGKLLTRDEILSLAPAHGTDPIDRSIDSRIKRLRRKLEQNGQNGDLIETARGNGYIYKGVSRI